jgi:SHS2 domain-containing protein
MSFTFLDHTADIKFRATGKTLANVFEQSALAMKEVIADKKYIKSSIKKKITISGEDTKDLLYQFLETILFFLDAESFIISKTKVTIKDLQLEATLWGDKTSDYQGLNHVKAPTFAEMYIKKVSSRWEAQVVLDV